MLRLGTASWSDPSWEGSLYPRGTPPVEYLRHYARRFDTVEVDSTWYAVPAATTIDGWDARTPDGFVFSLKAPSLITHQACLVNCERDVDEFLNLVERLGPKLGPVLFQFPYFRRESFGKVEQFLERLAPFLDRLPPQHRYAVEVRNRSWLVPPLLDVLRKRNVALALVELPGMPSASKYARIPDLITADFTYIRWIGDRLGIERLTKKWDRLVVDKTAEIETWANTMREITKGVSRTYAYFNNHYAGCAFRSAELFRLEWDGTPPSIPETPEPAEPTLPGLEFPSG